LTRSALFYATFSLLGIKDHAQFAFLFFFFFFRDGARGDYERRNHWNLWNSETRRSRKSFVTVVFLISRDGVRRDKGRTHSCTGNSGTGRRQKSAVNGRGSSGGGTNVRYRRQLELSGQRDVFGRFRVRWHGTLGRSSRRP
jgi:hypothetical protein